MSATVTEALSLAQVLELLMDQVDFHDLGGHTRVEAGVLHRLGCNPAGLARLARWSGGVMAGGELSIVLGGRPVVLKAASL